MCDKLSKTGDPGVGSARLVRTGTTHRIMRRKPGVWLVAHDNPRCGRVAAWTNYTVRIRRNYDGRWYHNYGTGDFSWALECWKRECAYKWPNTPDQRPPAKNSA